MLHNAIRALRSCLIVIALSTVSVAHAEDLSATQPLDADRALTQVDATGYTLSLATTQQVTFDAKKVKHVWIDEASIVSATVNDGRLVLRSEREGKAAVRIIWHEDDTIEMTHNRKHGMRMPRYLFMVTVTAD